MQIRLSINHSPEKTSHASTVTEEDCRLYLEVGGGRLLVGDHVLGLVEPAEKRRQSLF